MRECHLALVGFGNVVQRIARILRDRGDFLAEHIDVRFQIVDISELRKGSVYAPEGLNPDTLFTAIETDGGLHNAPVLFSPRTIAFPVDITCSHT